MFHVPGTYSGVKTHNFSWTQTRDVIELAVPLLPDARGSVTIAAKGLRVCASDSSASAPPLAVLDGELSAVVVVDDSTWTRDDSPRQLSITLRKAVPAVWRRLLMSDDE